MKRYLIESSIIVEYLRGNNKIIDFVDNLDGELTSSYICMAELYEGVARLKEQNKIEVAMKQFFLGMSEIYGIEETVAKQFGLIRAYLKKEGQVIEDIDILIGATCAAYNLSLVTLNQKHFSRIQNIQIFTL